MSRSIRNARTSRLRSRAKFVVDDKADIDRKRRPVIIDGDGVAVSAGPDIAFIDRDRITLRQRPGGGIAGNSRSDNRDPHCKALFPDVRDTGHGSHGFSGPANGENQHEMLVSLQRPSDRAD
jgi:hypothetical protein